MFTQENVYNEFTEEPEKVLISNHLIRRKKKFTNFLI